MSILWTQRTQVILMAQNTLKFCLTLMQIYIPQCLAVSWYRTVDTIKHFKHAIQVELCWFHHYFIPKCNFFNVWRGEGSCSRSWPWHWSVTWSSSHGVCQQWGIPAQGVHRGTGCFHRMGQELSPHCSAVLLPLLIQQLLLPRNLIPSLSWKRQPKEGSVCACVKVIMGHLNIEVFVLAW